MSAEGVGEEIDRVNGVGKKKGVSSFEGVFFAAGR